MYQAQERDRGRIPGMDRLLRRDAHDVGGFENGCQGSHSLPDCADTPFRVLWGRLYRAFVVYLYLSRVQVESIQDGQHDSVCLSRDSAGMLCESHHHGVVYKDPLINRKGAGFILCKDTAVLIPGSVYTEIAIQRMDKLV